MTRWVMVALAVTPFSPVVLALSTGEEWFSALQSHTGLLIWALTVSFSLVLFFVRGWMTRREKVEERFQVALDGMTRFDLKLVAVDVNVTNLGEILKEHIEEERPLIEQATTRHAEVIERLVRLESEKLAAQKPGKKRNQYS